MPVEQQWHALSPNQVRTAWGTSLDRGLTLAVVKERSGRYGSNELPVGETRRPLQIFIQQFTNVMLLMLLGVAAVSALLDVRSQEFPKDALAILVIVFLNGILGFTQESRAEKALAALKQLSAPQVRVIREGQVIEIASTFLVPGDLILLEAGGQVPADGRLIEAVNLNVRESALTGESLAVTKTADLILAPDAGLADRQNMVYQGTEIVQGRGTAVVVAIGQSTFLGTIAKSLQSVETENTPLQRRMAQLSQTLVTGSLLLVAVVVALGIFQTGVWQKSWQGWEIFLQESNLEKLLNTSLSMAVAVVPEGLPAVVTVTLALGTQRMARRQALIRSLPAVETLGSVTVICSDKTGTLTQNKMIVEAVQTNDHDWQVTGSGYTPQGTFREGGQPWDTSDLQVNTNLTKLLQVCVLCNDALLQNSGQNSAETSWYIIGDSTEGALLTLAAKVGIDRQLLSATMPRIAEIPFSSDRKCMSVLCQNSQKLELLTKGSVENVLAYCSFLQTDRGIMPLTVDDRQRIIQGNDRLSGRGMRVLGMAQREQSTTIPEEKELVWLGLVAMRDAPRPEAATAVALCRQAGIRPVMITGDHPATAAAIARDLGILTDHSAIVTGKELELISDDDLYQRVKEANVFARVAPEHKLRIVKALQHNGDFVAMTGDGVNDAPALKQSNIGIAMGITGTDVAKEASDMVLRDDNFATILAATEEGRVVYTNIRRFIKYILGSNIGEVLTIGAAPLFGLPDVPVTPLQILWMNLVTDGLPALALAVEPAEADIMKQPPLNPQESIFARGLGRYIICVGIIFGVITIGLMLLAFYTPTVHWRSIVFTTLCLAQMGHALSCRSDRFLLTELSPLGNPFLIGAVVFTSLLQILLLYVPFLQQFFGTEPLSFLELLLCLGTSFLIFLVIESGKLTKRRPLGNGESRSVR